MDNNNHNSVNLHPTAFQALMGVSLAETNRINSWERAKKAERERVKTFQHNQEMKQLVQGAVLPPTPTKGQPDNNNTMCPREINRLRSILTLSEGGIL